MFLVQFDEVLAIGLETCRNLPRRSPTSQIHKFCDINYTIKQMYRREAALLEPVINRTKVEKSY